MDECDCVRDQVALCRNRIDRLVARLCSARCSSLQRSFYLLSLARKRKRTLPPLPNKQQSRQKPTIQGRSPMHPAKPRSRSHNPRKLPNKTAKKQQAPHGSRLGHSILLLLRRTFPPIV